MAVRWFTPRSARRALERVRPTTERICRVYRELEARRPHRVQADAPVDPIYFLLVRELSARLRDLGREGVLLRDARAGRIDFPARRNGRAVWLCWQVGEATLRFWRELEPAGARRRPLDDDDRWDEAAPSAGETV